MENNDLNSVNNNTNLVENNAVNNETITTTDTEPRETVITSVNDNHVKEPFKLNKKLLMIIGGVVIGIILLVVILSRILGGNRRMDTNEIKFDDVVDLGDLINDVDNKINNNEIKLSNSSEAISSHYGVNSGIKEASVGVKIGDYTTKLLVVRTDKMTADIYKGTFLLKEYQEDVDGSESPLQQIGNYMETFRREISFRLGNDSKLITENLSGKSQYTFPIPTEESIYVEKRDYTSSYEVEDVFNRFDPENEESTKIKYDLNFYLRDNYLICELVRFY